MFPTIFSALNVAVAGHISVWTWRPHDMETISKSLALCLWNPPVAGGLLLTKQAMWAVDGFYGVRLDEVITHSVGSPSMVDPQWDIWYWGSKWNLHTVCWGAVGCEWGTTSVYFGITYVCFIPSRLPVFAVEHQYLLQDFLFLSKVSFEGHIQNRQKISCWFKIWMGFVGPILIKLWTSSIWGFL